MTHFVHPLQRRETGRQERVRRTRESVLRQLVREQIPMTAEELHDQLDVDGWSWANGADVRSVAEIRAALIWLEKNLYVRLTVPPVRCVYNHKMYFRTDLGIRYATETLTYETPKIQRMGLR